MFGAVLRALDFHVDGAGSRVARGLQNPDLLVDAAMKPAVILAAAAGSEQHAIGMARQELANRGDAALRKRQIVQAEFEEALSRLVFDTGVAEQCFYVLEAKCDADLWKNCPRRHPEPTHYIIVGTPFMEGSRTSGL